MTQNFSSYQNLIQLLDFYHSSLGLRINAKDVSGILKKDLMLNLAFTPYIVHSCSFCRHLKKYIETKAVQPCHNFFVKYTLNKCKRSTDAFYGCCMSGVYEYVVPVYYNKTLIFILLIGSFSNPEKTLKPRTVQRLQKRFKLSDEAIRSLQADYEKLPQKPSFSEKDLKNALGFIENLVRESFIYYFVKNKTEITLQKGEAKSPIIQHAITYINKHYEEKLTLNNVAENLKCSKSYLTHKFSNELGVSFVDFLQNVRIRNAIKLISDTNESLTNIALRCGFDSPAYFSKTFKKVTGVSPSEHRQKQFSPS